MIPYELDCVRTHERKQYFNFVNPESNLRDFLIQVRGIILKYRRFVLDCSGNKPWNAVFGAEVFL